MGKVFVHHPLKRAELKRLAAPPPPPPIPAKIRPPESDYAEKARRAAARAQARFEEEHRIAKFKDDIDLVKSVFKTIWIDSYHFCDWMKKLFDEDPTLYDKIMSDQPDCTLVDMFCPGVGKLCLYCNERAIKHAGYGWAGLMMSTIDITKDNEILSYVLCNRCAKLSYKAIIHKSAEIMVRKVRHSDDSKLIRKSTLQPLDLQYIGDNMPILISRYRSETVGFLKRLRDSDLIVNPEILDEFA